MHDMDWNENEELLECRVGRIAMCAKDDKSREACIDAVANGMKKSILQDDRVSTAIQTVVVDSSSDDKNKLQLNMYDMSGRPLKLYPSV